jgi:hypothetical protein
MKNVTRAPKAILVSLAFGGFTSLGEKCIIWKEG